MIVIQPTDSVSTTNSRKIKSGWRAGSDLGRFNIPYRPRLERTHGGIHGHINILWSNVFQQAGQAHPVAHRAPHLRKEQVDFVIAQIADQSPQHIRRADVEIGARAQVEQNGLRRRISLGAREDLCTCHIGVEEVQRRIQPQYHQAWNILRIRMTADIDVLPGCIRPFTQDRNVRPAGAVEQHDQRQHDRQDQARHHIRGNDTHQRRDRQREVGLALGIITLEFCDIEQTKN